MSRLLALAATVLTGQLAVGEEGALELEWRTRERALSRVDGARKLPHDLEDEVWRVRAAAVDAALRGRPYPPDEEKHALGIALVAMYDAHPSVRALAVEVLAELPPFTGGAVEERVTALATDLLPEVRIGCARLAGRWPLVPDPLPALCRDEDGRVRDEARRVLLGGRTGTDAARLLEEVVRAGDPIALIDALDSVRRRVHLDGGPATALDGPDVPPVVRTLLAAAAPGADTASVLARGWFKLFEDGRLRPDALIATIGGTAGEEVGVALIEELLAREGSLGPGGPTAAAERLLRVVRDALGPDRAFELALVEPLSDSATVVVLDELGGSLSRWDWAQGAELLARDSRVRDAAFEAIVRVWRLRHDRDSGDLLTTLLGGSDLAGETFRQLARGEDARPYAQALADYWRSQPHDQKMELVGDLPRTYPLEPFREELLAFSETGPEARGRAIDLLGPFIDDHGVFDALERWLSEELDVVRAAGEAGDEPRRRAAELRVLGILRTIEMHDDADAVRRAAQTALERGLDISTPVAERAAVLSSERDGWTLLLVGNPEVEASVRVEVAIVFASFGLASPGPDMLLDLLLEELPHQPWDRGARMVEAIGRLSPARARDWLAERAFDRGAPVVLRRAALAALASREEDGIAELLARVVERALDADTRLDAIRALAVRGSVTGERLAELWSAFVAGDAADVPLAFLGGDERRVVRLELLLALARTGVFDDALLGEVLAEPHAHAVEWLGARQRGERMARATSVWSGELELAGVLIDAGRGTELLEASGAWWRLDGRFLLALAHRASRTRSVESLAVARRLVRAARIALAGEPVVELEVRSLVLAADLALAAEEWEELGVLAEALTRGWRERRFSDSSWQAGLDRIDRRAERDPPSRVHALAAYARARSMLDEGREEEAARWLAVMEGRVGFSATAAREAGELRGLLGD